MKSRPFFVAALAGTLFLAFEASVWAQDIGVSSLSNQIVVVPAPGTVKIDGKSDDWDLSGGIWSYNDPTLVNKYSIWTHLMWDEKGVYFLARYNDPTPMINATKGKDFAESWKADAYQARVIFDDKTPDEHQMHINIFFSTPEKKPYMIVKHGGFKAKAPYDATGPDRPDLTERFGSTMDAAGGKIAFSAWPDGKGYNAEAFWPWKYVRLNGQPLKPGDNFVFGLDALWGNVEGTSNSHRLVDSMRDDKVNRIFFFRDRQGWGKAIISDKGKLDLAAQQIALQEARLKKFVDFDTYGSIPVKYELPDDREVTIAIDNAEGVRVRNLFGQFPRKKGPVTDLWDGLDDAGKPVPPGAYTVHVVDHQPVKVKILNSLYNAATPPWLTEGPRRLWGANHGYPTTIATRGDVILNGFTGVEGATGLQRVSADGIIQWTNVNEVLDATLDDKYAYTVSRNWGGQTDFRRIDLNNGRLTPFDDEAKSPETHLPLTSKELPDSTSIALFIGKIYILVPGRALYVVSPTTGAVESTLEAGDLLAVTERGDILYGLHQGGKITQLDAKASPVKTLFTAKTLKEPVRLSIAQDSKSVAVSDLATNQVFVFSESGKLQRTLGKPFTAIKGDRPAGAFIDTDLCKPWGLDFDSQGRLWVAEAAYHARRVTNWTTDGKLDRQFWGSANYGATDGFPLTFDSTRFVAQGVEFKLDPKPDFFNRPTAEKAIAYHPALASSRGYIYRLNGREYAVDTADSGKKATFSISLRNKAGVFVECVRVNYTKPANKMGPAQEATAWTDLNLNGAADPGETVTGVKGKSTYWVNGWTRPDLTIITADQFLYKPTGFTKDGVPLYDWANGAQPANAFDAKALQKSAGTLIMDDKGNLSDGILFSTVDGRKGSYPNPYKRHDAPAAQRGLLIAPFRTNGVVENVPGVGSITALGGDRGEWFLLSMDGLYLSSIGQDTKAEVTLDETFIGQESFGGFIWRDENDRVLIQLGGPSYRIAELTGLDTTRKSTQTINVTAGQVEAGQKIAQGRSGQATKEPEKLQIARVIALPTAPISPEAGTDLIPGAPVVSVQEPGDMSKRFRASLAHDGKNLAVMWQVNDASAWKNGEGRYNHAFIGGDSVDLKLEVPGRGAIRILGAPVGNKDTVAYWQKTSPTPENPTVYAVGNNMANAQKFDVVKRLDTAKLSIKRADTGYTALLTVPLSELGIDPVATRSLKGVIGVIFSDPAGQNRAARLYWHDKNTGLVSDVPSESSLTPNAWGTIEIAP